MESNGFVSVLDLHFGKKCSTRIDNFDEALEDKLNQIFKYCKDNSVNAVIFAGDIFDNNSIDRKSLLKAFKIFKQFNDNGISCFTIWGNHDEYRYNENFRENTPLYFLMQLDVMHNLFDLKIYKNEKLVYKIKGFDYLDDSIKEYVATQHQKANEKIVAIGHTFYENSFMGGEHNLTEEMVKKGNVDILILGHDHSKYSNVTVGTTKIYRFGSLVRDNSNENNMHRIPCFIHFNGDVANEVTLNCKELKDLIIAKVSAAKEVEIDYKELIEEIKITEEEEKEDTIMEAINQLENTKIQEIIRRNL